MSSLSSWSKSSVSLVFCPSAMLNTKCMHVLFLKIEGKLSSFHMWNVLVVWGFLFKYFQILRMFILLICQFSFWILGIWFYFFMCPYFIYPPPNHLCLYPICPLSWVFTPRFLQWSFNFEWMLNVIKWFFCMSWQHTFSLFSVNA